MISKTRNFPTQPGVYQMINTQGQVIYVGKAKNLKRRISSYFRTHLADRKTAVMMAQVADIQITMTANEVEALLLEANLVKQHRPRYNILLRDDKSYPYLFLSEGQDFPRLDFHRGPNGSLAIILALIPRWSGPRKFSADSKAI